MRPGPSPEPGPAQPKSPPLEGIAYKYAPGYYQVNYRAQSIKGMARMRGLFRLPLVYLITRFKKPSAATWMPQMWVDLECPECDLSERFQQVAAEPREKFKQLGFSELGFKKIRRIINPNYRDTGGINFLGESRCHYGQLIYNKVHAPPPIDQDRESVVIAFTAVFEHELLSCGNNTKTPYDSLPHHKVVRIASNDVASIYQHFVALLKQRAEQPRRFPDLPSLQSWFDSNALEIFEDRVRRGLYIRMSDDEVAIARRKLPPPLPNT
jgi:hypothetical protein